MRTAIRDSIRLICAYPPMRRAICWRGPRRSGKVALTFDDGPDPEGTPRILELLGRRGVRATFFLLGKQIEKAPDLARRIAAEGHEIALHGYAHAKRNAVADVPRCAALLAQLGIAARLYRPPHGVVSLRELLWLARRGYTTVLWSFDSMDSMRHTGRRPGPAPDYDAVRGGDIVLMHDDAPECLGEIPLLLDEINRKGLRAVTVSELLGGKGI